LSRSTRSTVGRAVGHVPRRRGGGQAGAHSPLRDLGRAIAHFGAWMRYTVAHSVLDEDYPYGLATLLDIDYGHADRGLTTV